MAKSLLSVFKSVMEPGAGEFLIFNPKTAADKWEIREQGRARGTNALPTLDSEAMDEVELEIVNAVRAIAAESEKKPRLVLAR